ncbi:MAG TPA: NAD-dependent succinate-semialdehyde dehydrogenase [Acidiferrobacterales bacterium]|nr:NAD-dependent succinate-semialdehyde dehydrogenase [Acidiferrobacterales bacterium]
MAITTQNPANGETLKTFVALDNTQIDTALQQSSTASVGWAATSIADRSACLRSAAQKLRAQRDRYAALITLEMGKPIREARAEVEKCATGCEFYAQNAERFLADEVIATDAGRSYIAYQPLGTLLAIMPWNFPFWQAFRAAAPALVAGNTALLKHASNVPQCALAIEEIFQASFPANVFRTLLIGPQQAEKLIADPRIHAVTLTGSEAAGRRIAAAAGMQLKKSVLELGGSDAFVVLADADLDMAARLATASRFLNGGQSCIAAKRIILVESIAEDFLARFRQQLAQLKLGDPTREDTDLGPMARADLRDTLHRQVTDSIKRGATPVMGCEPVAGPGYYYKVSLLDMVRPGMPAYEDELFGPVAAVIRAKDEADALHIANDSRYGLGGSVCTGNPERGEAFARAMHCGQAFVNGMVKSDPRLPFGGIKASGYGRELALQGIREFVNIKTIWMKD